MCYKYLSVIWKSNFIRIHGLQWIRLHITGICTNIYAPMGWLLIMIGKLRTHQLTKVYKNAAVKYPNYLSVNPSTWLSMDPRFLSDFLENVSVWCFTCTVSSYLLDECQFGIITPMRNWAHISLSKVLCNSFRHLINWDVFYRPWHHFFLLVKGGQNK